MIKSVRSLELELHKMYILHELHTPCELREPHGQHNCTIDLIVPKMSKVCEVRNQTESFFYLLKLIEIRELHEL